MRVKAKERQMGRFRPKPGAPGRFGSGAQRVAGREAAPAHGRRTAMNGEIGTVRERERERVKKWFNETQLNFDCPKFKISH